MPHAWQRIPETTTVEERIKALENDKGNVGSAYNACVARKYLAETPPRKVDVSLRFKCVNCNEYQEVDMEVDGQLKECKGGNKSAKKKQTMNYVQISQVQYGGAPVEVLFQTAARAVQDTPHVAGWGAAAKHEACP